MKKYRHKETRKIAEYDSTMGLWYVKNKWNEPISNWQLEKSNDWEEIEDEKIFSIDNLKQIYKNCIELHGFTPGLSDLIIELKCLKK